MNWASHYLSPQYQPSVYRSTPFIPETSNVSPLVVDTNNALETIGSLPVNPKCKVLLRATIWSFLTRGRVPRLLTIVESQFELIRTAWPSLLVEGEKYRFIRDYKGFLGLEKIDFN